MYQYRLRTLFAWIWVLAVVVALSSWLLGPYWLDLWDGFYVVMSDGFGVDYPPAREMSGATVIGLLIGLGVLVALYALGVLASVYCTAMIFWLIKGKD